MDAEPAKVLDADEKDVGEATPLDVPGSVPGMASPAVVALGASAGGLAAFDRFFKAIEGPTGLAFVVVQHLSPEHESILPQLLSAFTDMPVTPVVDGTPPEADHVYVIPPGTALVFRDGRLWLTAMEPRASRQPISAFFASLGAELGGRAVAVVLSGTGGDGAAGLHAVHSRGGLAIVQSPSEAQYDSMPRSAIATGDADFVVSAGDMPALILREMGRRPVDPSRAVEAPHQADPLAAVTDLLGRTTGKHFGSFKRTTLLRRIQRRLVALGLSEIAEYVARLEVDQAEATTLAADLMIGVTHFFRDAGAFKALDELVLPRLFDLAGDQPVRVWVPGCSSGEEAYSIAIQLALHAGQRPLPPASTTGVPRFQVFATDINEAALARARLGRFSRSIARDVPADLLRRFFMEDDQGFTIAREVRDACIFSPHDVMRDPPFRRIDLISCRNFLIYVDAEAQRQILPIFHYALRPSGYLFLGNSEALGDLSNHFETLDARNRIFRRGAGPGPRVRFPLQVAGSALPRASSADAASERALADAELGRCVASAVLDEQGGAAAVVDAQGSALYFAGPVSRYLPTPTGAPTTNILELAHGELRLELSSALQAAQAGFTPIRRSLLLETSEHPTGAELLVKHLPSPGAQRKLFLVRFKDIRPQEALLEHGAGDDRTQHLEGELRDATDRWRSAVQDLESTNEELRSANEELQTMNEELQSSNEELQLSQEELQSVNEELNTVNTELASKVEEVNDLYADLQNLFQSTRIATIMLDRDLSVVRFTPAAARLYPLSQNDEGRPLSNLSDPFLGSTVLEDAHGVLDDLVPRERVLTLANGSGWHLLRALPYLSATRSVEGVVLTFVDITDLKQAETALREAQAREHRRAAELEAIMRSAPAAVFIAHDPGATKVTGNDAAYRLLRTPPGQNLAQAAPPQERASHYNLALRGRPMAQGTSALERAAATGAEVRDAEEEVHFLDGTHVHLLGHAIPLLDAAGQPAGAVAAFMDVTHLKDVEDALRAGEARFKASLEALLDGFGVFRPAPAPRDRRAYEIEHLNAPARDILGAKGGERWLDQLVPGRSALLEMLAEAAGSGAPVERPETAGGGSGDDRRLYDIRASPIERGEVVVAWHDVTERARATEALRDADRRKDDFLASLGHELRNPLAALRAAVEVEHLQHTAKSRGDQRRRELILRQIHTLGRLVDDLLDVTRITRGKLHLDLRPVDLVEIVRAECTARELTMGSLRLQLTAPEVPVWIHGDAERVAQVAGNLLTNAIKFGASGGLIEVSVEARDGARPTLVVRDHGVGVPADLLGRLFEPFWQAAQTIDRARGGLGLGLALVKGMSALMGAEVEARSDGPGRGAEFRITFCPASAPVPAQAQSTEPSPSAAHGRTLRILVIEDNPDVREALVEFLGLSRRGEVKAVGDAEQGLAMALAWDPEVILCDVGLPGIDGYAFAQRVRSTPALVGTYLVALTGYGAEVDKARSRAAGFDRHMVKPLKIDELDRFLAELPETLGRVDRRPVGKQGPSA